MRTFVTAAIAVVAGVHCSATSYSGEAVASDEIATEEPTSPSTETRKSEETTETESDDPRWGIKAEGLPPFRR